MTHWLFRRPPRTVGDFIRQTVRRFNRGKLVYGHGTATALDEAVFLTLEALSLPPDTYLTSIWDRPLTAPQLETLNALIDRRIKTRLPAPYLVHRAYIQGIPFYVDERVLIPRSFIGELLLDEDGFSPPGFPEDVKSVLDLCTGSACLAIIAAMVFPDAVIDATDISEDALIVARRNVEDHGLEGRITLFQGDLFESLSGRKYDLIIANPPYVDAGGMAALPPEYRHEPALALGSGDDGLDAVRRILNDAPKQLNPGGGLLCEVGRGRANIEAAFPTLRLLWLGTENSDDEVFWWRP